MTRSLLIFNPVAGRGRAARLLPQVEAALCARGVAYDLAPTHESLHAVQLAWEAPGRGYERVLAVGGDGLIHEIVNGLLRASGEGPTLPLAIIPVGSGNDFNKMVPPVCAVGQTHDDWRAAIDRLTQGETRLFDAGRITGDTPSPGHPHPNYFQNGMDIGFGAQVARYARDVPPFLSGFWQYLAAALKTLRAYTLPRVRIELDDGTRIEYRTTMTAVTNGRCFGGGFWIAPQAEASDGLLDVMTASELGRGGILGLIPRVMKGTHVTHPAVRMARARRVRIESPDPLIVEADGEIPFLAAHQLEVEVLPRRLCLIV